MYQFLFSPLLVYALAFLDMAPYGSKHTILPIITSSVFIEATLEWKYEDHAR